MEQFKKGDKVFDIRYGWGEVVLIKDGNVFPVKVNFENYNKSYKKDGREIFDNNPSLSKTEYSMRAKPNNLPRMVLVRDDVKEMWLERELLADLSFYKKFTYPYICRLSNPLFYGGYKYMKELKEITKEEAEKLLNNEYKIV